MSFADNIIPDTENNLLQELNKNMNSFSPLVFCEFFQGMEVLQIYGEETKEYIFAHYFSGKLVGHTYLGSYFTESEIGTLKRNYFPPTLDMVDEYVKKTDGIWYYKYDQSQYAFVLQQPCVLQKLEIK